MAFYRFLADLVVVFHAAYVGFVVLVPVVVLLGWALRWGWVRNVWFRSAHLAMIGVVAAEAVLGIVCPLTMLEKFLRRQAGQEGYPGDFVGHWAHELIFGPGRAVPPWALTATYVGFTILVALLFVLAPPRLKRRQC